MLKYISKITSGKNRANAVFDRFLSQGDSRSAERFAIESIQKGKFAENFVTRLFDLYEREGRYRSIVDLHDRYRGQPAFGRYPNQISLARALIETDRPDKARALLLTLILETRFVEPLRLYRRVADGAESVDAAIAAFARSQRTQSTRVSQSSALADIAIAGGQLNRAGRVMLRALGWVASDPQPTLPKRKANVGGRAGRDAIHALHDLLKDVPFFLISGTLLGVIREGRLLGHDKDIDIGVLGNDHRADIVERVRSSRTFTEIFVPTSDLISLRCDNGVKVDIFFHYVQNGVVWHGSHLHAWDNSRWWRDGASPYARVTFEGRDFLIPSDSDRYLTENYGDWRTPNPDYDASLEAPNRRLRNRELVRLHWQKLILKYFTEAEFKMLGKAVDIYARELGSDAFLRRAADALLLRDPFETAATAKGDPETPDPFLLTDGRETERLSLAPTG